MGSESSRESLGVKFICLPAYAAARTQELSVKLISLYTRLNSDIHSAQKSTTKGFLTYIEFRHVLCFQTRILYSNTHYNVGGELKTYKNAAEVKLARIAWKLKLLETSAKVTRTPGTTLKSLLLDAVKEEGSANVARLEKGFALVNAALNGSTPLVRSHRNLLSNKIR